jgi:hypothetical protein
LTGAIRGGEPYHKLCIRHSTNFVDNFVQVPRDKLGKALFGAACEPMPVKQAVPFAAMQWVKNMSVHNFCG